MSKTNIKTNNKDTDSLNNPLKSSTEQTNQATFNPDTDSKIHKIPFYCNIFKLADILKIDSLELVKKYKQVLNQDVIDIMEYLPKDDLELFLLECGYEFEIQEHHPNIVKRPMIVTIMGHVDHGM